MNRSEAIRLLDELVGRDLHALADELGVPVRSASGNVNKGWAGQVCEVFLGLQPNSLQEPDFGDWELKVIPMKRTRANQLVFKETMAVTMIDPVQVAATEFEESHLLSKLKRALIIAREVGPSVDDPTYIRKVVRLDLDSSTREIVRNDYEEVRSCIRDPERGFSALTGLMGTYIQPRTKGPGNGSISRAFYARKEFLRHVVGI